jgi:hypothetical protein
MKEESLVPKLTIPLFDKVLSLFCDFSPLKNFGWNVKLNLILRWQTLVLSIVSRVLVFLFLDDCTLFSTLVRSI